VLHKISLESFFFGGLILPRPTPFPSRTDEVAFIGEPLISIHTTAEREISVWSHLTASLASPATAVPVFIPRPLPTFYPQPQVLELL
jgi:hypothetical protein